jgi:hypothetical protein
MNPMIGRYLRAFVIALRMTLRGETPPPKPDSPLREWMAQGLNRLDQIESLAAQYQIDSAQVMVHIDMRDMRMLTILRTVRFHLTDEYPMLLRPGAQSNLTGLYANNLDDHHRVSRLADASALAGTPVQQAVMVLATHLEAIPRQHS